VLHENSRYFLLHFAFGVLRRGEIIRNGVEGTRISGKGRRKQLFKEFSQEALVWSQLEHPNVLPFLGTNMDLFPDTYCLVSPWCSHGNVMIYLSTHPEANKTGIILDILQGLEYLHTRNPPVVHGDLKGANILVSDLGQCCLADFGLAGMMSTLQTPASTGHGTNGSIRWMAPELFDYTTSSKLSTSTDMYSLGCTIITGSPPFSEVKPDIAVSIQVMHGFRPLRPVEGFSDRLWTAVERCWLAPDKRHTVKTFMVELSMQEWTKRERNSDSRRLKPLRFFFFVVFLFIALILIWAGDPL
ncbi:kinase-like protein, partial [Gymnopus androsaceus JB14]